ncbi:MAG: TolC family protein [Spirochaetes bacterium]|nr:TolC family protein [Spirochaetota bacterium]
MKFICAWLIIASAAVSAQAARMTEDEYVRLAVAADDELTAAAIGIESRSLAWRLGIREFFPAVTLEYGGDERVAVGAPDSFSKHIGITAEQLAWDGGRSASGRLLSAKELAVERDAFRRSSEERAEAARATFRAYLALGMKAGIARTAADAAYEQLVIARVEFGLGMIRELDVLDLEAKAEELELAFAELDSRKADAGYALLRALKSGMDRRFEFEGDVDVKAAGLDLSPSDPVLAALAVSKSPELASARLELERSQAEVEASARAWWPRVEVQATCTFSGYDLPLDRFSWSLGVNVGFSEPFLPVSGSLTLGGAERERSASYSSTAKPAADLVPYASRGEREWALSRAALLVRETADDAARAFESTAGTYARARNARAIAERRRDLAAKRRDLSRRLIETGGITRSDFLETEEELARAETVLVDAALAQWQAERAAETKLDIPPGGLASFLNARGGLE